MSTLPEISSPPKQKRQSEAHRASDRTLQKFNDEPTISRIALRTEEEQQAAAREREERDRRDARRKSLANRRVSFAAEATLHTFHIEYIQDSTTSTDSSRRASTLSAASRDNTGYGPSIEQAGNGNASANQKRSSLARRSDDDTITSTYSSDSEPADAVEEVIDEEDEDDMDSSNSESEDGTMMTIDTEDITGVSMGSDGFDQDSESSLDLALRQAAERANTQQLESEHGTQGFDDEEEVIPSFGWVKKPAAAPTQDPQEPEQTQAGMDMDMTSAIGGIINADDTVNVTQYEDMSMDVTNVLGGILGNRTLVGVDADEAQSALGDATMEFTTALGGIQQHEESDDIAEFEDMSMELTTVLGGVLPQKARQSIVASRRRTVSRADDAEDGMDMTVGLGNILSTEADNTTEMNDSNDTMGMDMTVALGGIVGGATFDGPLSPVKKLARSHSSFFVPDSSPIVMSPKRASPRRTPQQPKTAPSSNSFAAGQLPVRTKTPSPLDDTQRFMRMTRSRSRSLTPSPTKTRSAAKSPKAKMVSAKASTPVKNSKVASTTVTPSRSSQKQSNTQPGLVLQTPPSRRLSGIGADRDGLGSPTVASIIDRRASIGDSASHFVPGQPLMTFDSPKDLAREMAKEDEAIARERAVAQAINRGVSFTQEDRDATANLVDLIGSLSPAKKPLNGRKSLHVGSARGVLGKRPAELDGDEDDTYEEKDGVDRLRGHQSSPVKKIRLQKPSFGAEIGRLALQGSTALDLRQATTPNRFSPVKSVQAPATTPRRNGGFRDVRDHHTIHEMSLDVQGPAAESDQIRLQDFLDMTSIRFMELNTTKRRHTTAPTLVTGEDDPNADDMSLERCVVASACTVPKLELFQHSCRELKKYISEGRRMVKEIEEDTYEDNPPLFKEYMSAPPDVKALMDNQFKNVKTHARLLSKAMWYEWRMKLQDGLKEGLVKINRDMDQDFVYLAEQEELLSSVLPELDESFNKLDAQRQDLETAAQELADCDPEVLDHTRTELGSLKAEIEEKRRQIEQLQSEHKASTVEVEDLSTKKDAILADIAQSEKIREDCRGWNSSEVRALKERVDALEEAFGWAVTGISGTVLSLSYKREIELVVDTSSFEAQGKPSQVDLWYIADSREAHPVPRTVEKEFFLQCIRENIRSLPQRSTDMASLLKTVQKDWDTARFASEQIERLTTTFPTKVTKTSDTSIQLSTSMLLRALSTRIEIVSEFQGDISKNGLSITVTNSAEVQYGQHFQVNKIKDFLTSRMGTSVHSSGDSWCDAFVELQGKLIARGRK